MLSKFVVSALLLFLIVTAEGCPSRHEATVVSQDDRVEAEWNRHANVIERVLAGKGNVTGDYLMACIFFQKLTGISISGEMNYDGWTPDDRSREDFRRVEQWYVQNRDKLCWDENARSVRLCGQMHR
jgi:hypothetical protein